MSVMHFTELNSAVIVSCCPGFDLDPPSHPPEPHRIPNHAKIDVPEAHPSRSGATKARWTPRGHLNAAGSGVMRHMGRLWRVYLWFYAKLNGF